MVIVYVGGFDVRIMFSEFWKACIVNRGVKPENILLLRHFPSTGICHGNDKKSFGFRDTITVS